MREHHAFSGRFGQGGCKWIPLTNITLPTLLFGGCSSNRSLAWQSRPGRKQVKPMFLPETDANVCIHLALNNLQPKCWRSSFRPVSSRFDLFRPKKRYSPNPELLADFRPILTVSDRF
jgi:hypothetical protein